MDSTTPDSIQFFKFRGTCIKLGWNHTSIVKSHAVFEQLLKHDRTFGTRKSRFSVPLLWDKWGVETLRQLKFIPKVIFQIVFYI